MKTVKIKGLDISALSLGTVQLGLSYGINNADGKPSQETANAILDAALAGGINTLDTAGAYGDSEVVIGNWLKTIAPEKRPFIVTKAAHLDHSSLENPHGKHSLDPNALVFLFEPLLHYAIKPGAMAQTWAAF